MADPRTHIEDGVRFQKLGMLERALSEFETTLTASDDPGITGEALCRQAQVYRAWCRWDDAIGTARRSAEIGRAAGLEQVEGEALNAEAIVHQELARFDEAVALYHRILGLRVDDRLRGIVFLNLGAIAAQRADLERAEEYFRSSYRLFGGSGYQWGEAFALTNFCAVNLDFGKLKSAEIIGQQAIRAAKKSGDLELLGIALLNTAEALAAQKELDRAETMASEALGYFQMEENDLRRAQSYRVLGDIKIMQNHRGEARRLYAIALTLAGRVGSQREVARINDCLLLAGEAE